jgi:hypothetical protein
LGECCEGAHSCVYAGGGVLLWGPVNERFLVSVFGPPQSLRGCCSSLFLLGAFAGKVSRLVTVVAVSSRRRLRRGGIVLVATVPLPLVPFGLAQVHWYRGVVIGMRGIGGIELGGPLRVWGSLPSCFVRPEVLPSPLAVRPLWPSPYLCEGVQEFL